MKISGSKKDFPTTVKRSPEQTGRTGVPYGSISSKAEEMDMGWLDELESMVFR